MVDLRRVKKGKVLHWPPGFAPDDARIRLREGEVMDYDQPFEADWCEGQEYKLEPAGKDDPKPAPITLPQAVRKLRSLKKDPPPPVKVAPAPEAVKPEALPAIDEAPKRWGPKK